MLKTVHWSRDSRLGLAGGSRLASRQKLHTRRACKGAEQSCQLEHYRTKIQTGHSANSRLELATQSSREVKSPASPVLEKLTIRIPFSHQYKYPSFPQNMGGYSERKTLREVSSNTKPIRESYSFLERNLYSLFSFPLSLSYLLRGDFYPNTTHTHLECWVLLELWETLEDAKDGGCYGL